MKIAFQQPLVPVLPVARELIAKTKWVHTKGHQNDTPKRIATPKQNGTPPQKDSLISRRLRTLSMKSPRSGTPTPTVIPPLPTRGDNDLSALGLVSEPLPINEDDSPPEERRAGKRNILRVFGKRRRSKSRTRGSFESGSSVSVSTSFFWRAAFSLIVPSLQVPEPPLPRSSQNDPARSFNETASASDE